MPEANYLKAYEFIKIILSVSITDITTRVIVAATNNKVDEINEKPSHFKNSEKRRYQEEKEKVKILKR